MERTLCIIKPDATRRNLVDSINKIIEDGGLKVIVKKNIKLSIEEAKKFYKVHNDKPFYLDLVDYMASHEIVIQVLEANDAVKKYREIMGSTDPQEAKKGTIRKLFAISKQENSVHGSDSIENAKNEINFFFNDNEIIE